MKFKKKIDGSRKRIKDNRELEYSKSQVNRAGVLIVDVVTLKVSLNEKDNFEKWLEALEILNYWRSHHAYPINTFQATLRNKLRNIDKNALIAQRLKRLPSIIKKLRKIKGMKLARMHDIGGLRAVTSSLKKVREIEANYKNTNFSHSLHRVDDYIKNPKATGYRGIHLVYKYKNNNNPAYDGQFLELQIRTRIQHAWATAVETVGTYIKSALKSSEGPKEWLSYFSLVGSAFSHIEGTAPIPEYKELSKIETFLKVHSETKRLGVVQKLKTFSIATRHISIQKSKGSYYLIILDLDDMKVQVFTYAKKDLTKANKQYTELEKKITGSNNLQVVLVSADSVNNLKAAYPSYFLDTKEFLRHIRKIGRIALDDLEENK